MSILQFNNFLVLSMGYQELILNVTREMRVMWTIKNDKIVYFNGANEGLDELSRTRGRNKWRVLVLYCIMKKN